MMNFPHPKAVLKRINAICRTYVWTGKTDKSNKSPVAWSRVCSPVKQGGLGVINLLVWNQVTLLKCLWNICNMSDNLWIRWIHKIYLKERHVDVVVVGQSWSWIVKKVMKQVQIVTQYQQVWNQMLINGKFSMQTMYKLLIYDSNRVNWYSLLMHNMARPKSKFTLWMLCHGHLPTKDRLMRFETINEGICSLCGLENEKTNLIFFSCCKITKVWFGILKWLEFTYTGNTWDNVCKWSIVNTKGKGWRAKLLKLSITETIHEVWRYRNTIVFGNDTLDNNVVNRVIECIAHRG